MPLPFRAFVPLASCGDGAAVSERLFGCPRFGPGTGCRYHRCSSTVFSSQVLVSSRAHSSTFR